MNKQTKMHRLTQLEIINYIGKLSASNTSRSNSWWDIVEVKRHLLEIATNVDSRSMFFSGGKIGDAGAIILAEILKSNTSLEQVDIQNHNIGDEGAKALAEALKYNSRLRFIDISGNKIGDEGIIALVKAIEHNKTLELIDPHHNNITDQGKVELVKIIDRVKDEFIHGEDCCGCVICA